MNTCGTCRFWGVYRDRRGVIQIQNGTYRQCGRLQYDKHGVCSSSDKEIREHLDGVEAEKCLNHPLRQELAVMVSEDGGFAALESRKDFGCVLWEAKDS